MGPKPVDECEIRVDGGWQAVDISEALALRHRRIEMRCPECHGPVRAHREYNDGARAHFEHLRAHAGCSLKPGFNGRRTLHPDALS
ncbi:MAG TPA: hypothetical protein VKS60_11430 [Stellaceae bacterium]|nr:hypothetical protein [Stellaceae bacterium]